VSNTSYVKFKNEIYFVADDGVHGNELWKTNGTSDGTVLLKDINENPGYWPNTGNASAQISKVFVNNDKLFFYSDSTNSTKRTLWVSDGTTLGTLELSNEIETLNSVFYVNVSNSVIFTGLNEKYGNE
jgi:ELWxxDGT repeat protein